MQTENCYFSSQLNHFSISNADSSLDNHIRNCPTCSKKSMRIINQDKALDNFFSEFKITNSVDQQLRSELLETFKNLNLEQKTTKAEHLEAFGEAVKLNMLCFLANMVKPFQLGLLGLSITSFVVLYLLLRPI